MTVLQVSAILLGLTTLLFSINQRIFRLPNSIGMMLLALCSSIILAGIQWSGATFVRDFADILLSEIDLNAAVVNGFLCLLLFAGAMHVDVRQLYQERFAIGALATGGVILSTMIIGILTWIVTTIVGLDVPLLYCLVFGALISPTDAVTVLLFLRNSNVPQNIESKITGESLLNDGMSIVLFMSLLGLASGSTEVRLATLPFAVMMDIGGAIITGVMLGWIASSILKHAADENRYLSLLTTLALATGSFSLADGLGYSGPIAVVVAGLFVGNASSILTGDSKDTLLLHDAWDLIDEILTSILFVIIGLELLSISTQYSHLFVAALLIPVSLAARYLSIHGTLRFIPRLYANHPSITNILTWSGLRGGISIALVLSLPSGEIRDVLMTATYAIVVFSVFVQGPTLNSFIKTQTKSG